jgi:hypothetical protein
MAPRHPTATRDETIAAILKESGRPSTVPFRNALLQGGPRGARVPGPFAEFVGRGRESAWDQYALLVAWASGEPHDVLRDSRIWARALGFPDDAAGRSRVSRNWGFLKEVKLVEVERRRRLANVTLLREDGSGQRYRHPGEDATPEYFQVPFAYWTGGYHDSLSFAAKAMLLVALAASDRFELPAERAQDWYGISESSARRGFRELREAGVLTWDKEERSAPLAPKGYTLVNRYSLLPPFRKARRRRRRPRKAS